jgi:RNA recognition motif-containing protein
MSHFEKYGKVQESILMLDRNTGRSRCFGFVIMEDPESLDRILSEPQLVDSRKVDCKRAVPRSQGHAQVSSPAFQYKSRKMFVGGLPADVTNENFRQFFLQFGDIEDSIVILDKDTGRPRGFGFITFADDDSADKVLMNYENNMINGKWVECKKATPRQQTFPSYSMPYLMYSPYGTHYGYDNTLAHSFTEFEPQGSEFKFEFAGQEFMNNNNS